MPAHIAQAKLVINYCTSRFRIQRKIPAAVVSIGIHDGFAAAVHVNHCGASGAPMIGIHLHAN